MSGVWFLETTGLVEGESRVAWGAVRKNGRVAWSHLQVAGGAGDVKGGKMIKK